MLGPSLERYAQEGNPSCLDNFSRDVRVQGAPWTGTRTRPPCASALLCKRRQDCVLSGPRLCPRSCRPSDLPRSRRLLGVEEPLPAVQVQVRAPPLPEPSSAPAQGWVCAVGPSRWPQEGWHPGDWARWPLSHCWLQVGWKGLPVLREDSLPC